jgi:hypothetical protein
MTHASMVYSAWMLADALLDAFLAATAQLLLRRAQSRIRKVRSEKSKERRGVNGTTPARLKEWHTSA